MAGTLRFLPALQDVSQRRAAPWRRCGHTVIPFSSPSEEGNGAPGGARGLRGPSDAACEATSARRGPARLARADKPGCQDGFARPTPRRARPAMTGLRGPPSGRCASRRSTADRVVSGRSPLRPTAPHECAFRGVRKDVRLAIRLYSVNRTEREIERPNEEKEGAIRA